MKLTLNECINETENWGAVYLCECDVLPAVGSVFADVKGGAHTVLSVEDAGDGMCLIRFDASGMNALGRLHRSVTVNGSELREANA